jgi:hypothetical protein
MTSLFLDISGHSARVIEHLKSSKGRADWRRSIARGVPRKACLASVVHETTGLCRIEDLSAVMDEVDARILSGALLESPKIGSSGFAGGVGPSCRTQPGAFAGRLL